MVQELTQENFGPLTSEGKVVVDFYADWCGPCQMLKPVFAELSSEYDDVMFVKVNTEHEPGLAQEFEVRSIPTMVIMKDGQEVGRFSGFMPKAMLKQKIDQVLK